MIPLALRMRHCWFRALAIEAVVGAEEVVVDLVGAVGQDLIRTCEELHTILEVEETGSKEKRLKVRKTPHLMRHLRGKGDMRKSEKRCRKTRQTRPLAKSLQDRRVRVHSRACSEQA
jgi:hypothetical protein